MGNVLRFAPVLAGFWIVLSGFIYDLMFAGIPYQDPTPELAASYAFHSAVSGLFYKAGAILFVFGLVWLIIYPFFRRRTES